MSLKMMVKRIQNDMIRGAHRNGRSAYLVHRALKENIMMVCPAIMDFYDDWMPGVCSYSIRYQDGYDESCLDPRNYPKIWTGLKRGEDKAVLEGMQWP